jgi:hypothetical protein
MCWNVALILGAGLGINGILLRLTASSLPALPATAVDLADLPQCVS